MKTCGPSNKPPDLHKYKHTPTQNSQRIAKRKNLGLWTIAYFTLLFFLNIIYAKVYKVWCSCTKNDTCDRFNPSNSTVCSNLQLNMLVPCVQSTSNIPEKKKPSVLFSFFSEIGWASDEACIAYTLLSRLDAVTVFGGTARSFHMSWHVTTNCICFTWN